MNTSTAVKLIAALVIVSAVLAANSAFAQNRFVQLAEQQARQLIDGRAGQLQPGNRQNRDNNQQNNRNNGGGQPELKLFIPEGPGPGPGPGPGFRDTPTLGFMGYQTCHGMVVTRALRNTEAWRIGLEQDDVIIAIDGYRLTREGDYERAMDRAGRRVELKIRDARGRGIFFVTAFPEFPGQDIRLRSQRN